MRAYSDEFDLILLARACVKNRTDSGRMAHVATMRKLTRMLYHMLKTREHWKWERKQLTERKLSNLGGEA